MSVVSFRRTNNELFSIVQTNVQFVYRPVLRVLYVKALGRNWFMEIGQSIMEGGMKELCSIDSSDGKI